MKKLLVLGSVLGALILTGVGCSGNTPTKQSQTPVINPPAQPAAVTPAPTAPAPTTLPATMPGRESFGPQVSPDGKWLLASDQVEVGTPAKLKNRLIIRGLFGQGEQVLFSNEVANSNGTSNILQQAGWSKDGLKVYFVSSIDANECGGAYPDQRFAGDTLYIVSVATGKEKSIFQTQGSGCGSLYGIHDVYATKNLVLFEQPVGDASTEKLKYNIYISDLNNGSKKLVTTVTGTDGVSADTISPDGTRVALVTNYNSPDFKYKLLVVDAVSGATKEIAMPKNDRNYFQGWVDNNSISVSTANGNKNIQVP